MMPYYFSPKPYSQYAFVCGSSGGDLLGVSQDVQNMTSHLQSPFGGAFDSKQTEIHSNSNNQYTHLVTQLQVRIDNQQELLDYFLFYFSGHGFTDLNKNNDLRIYVGNGNGGYCHLSATLLFDYASKIARKSTLIFDCCRKIPDVPKPTLGDKTELVNESVKHSGLTHSEGRQLFSQQINSCPNGQARLFSCSIDEYSVDSSDGGEYTQSLIDETYRWINSNGNTRVLPFQNTFSKQMKFFYEGVWHKQTPSKQGNLQLPFAVR